MVKGTTSEKAAHAFISFVRSDEGRSILEKYGFRPVK
jgi:ABC-type molybdate transport system substrate-binding protein